MQFFALAALVVLLDQATKYWVVSTFTLYESLPVIPGFFNLTYLSNTGAAFGLLAGQPALWRQVFFIGVGVVALVVLTIMYRQLRKKSPWYTVSLGLIAGGAIGNLIDRVRQGFVTDFLDVYIGSHHWPAFNVADSGIFVGVTLFLVYSFFFEEKEAGEVVEAKQK